MSNRPLSAAELSFRSLLANPREYAIWARKVRREWEQRSICWWHHELGRWLMQPPRTRDGRPPDNELRGLVSTHPEALTAPATWLPENRRPKRSFFR